MIISIFKKYIWILNIFILILIAYLVASMINDSIREKLYSPENIVAKVNQQNVSEKFRNLDTKTPPRSYYDIILNNNIFGEVASLETGAQEESEGDAPKTSLNVQLLGTFLNTTGESIAVIKNMDNEKVDGYMDGQTVDIITGERVRLVSVENCRAVINRGSGKSETIECKRDVNLVAASNNTRQSSKEKEDDSEEKQVADGIRLVDDNKWMIEKKMLDELLEDPTSLINQARVVPQRDGMRFFGIRPSSIFYKIGLRNGDTLHRINDVELSDVENALTLFGELKNESEFYIDFTRRGKKFTYEYTVN